MAEKIPASGKIEAAHHQEAVRAADLAIAHLIVNADIVALPMPEDLQAWAAFIVAGSPPIPGEITVDAVREYIAISKGGPSGTEDGTKEGGN